MPITRSITDASKVTDWTKEITNLPILAGAINAMNLFEERGSAASSITFAKETRDYSMLPTNDRRLRDASAGKGRVEELFALSIPYFNHQDTLTTEDVAEYREWDDPNDAKSTARAKAAKIEDMKIRADQTKEYMKMEALKGVTIDPEGNTLADMFTEFGVAQPSTDFVLGTDATDITAKIHEVIRSGADNNRSGLASTMPIVLCGKTFFDKFVVHPDVEAAYASYLNSGTQRLRDNLFDFTPWGAIGGFEHRGLIFVQYNPTFTKPDGTTVTPILDADGYVIHPNSRDLYRGYNGPSNKFSKANKAGAPIALYEYAQERDNGIDFEMEMAPLYFMTNPLLSHKVTTSN